MNLNIVRPRCYLLIYFVNFPTWQDIYDFVDRSNVGDLLLKTLMCKLGNLSPFWQTDPFHACKYRMLL